MKISIPIIHESGDTAITLLNTDVVELTAVFNPDEERLSIPALVKYAYDGELWQNANIDIPVNIFDPVYEGTYVDDDLVYKDGTLTIYEYLTGLFKLQPYEYVAPQSTGWDYTTWNSRYVKLQDIPTEYNGYHAIPYTNPTGGYSKHKAFRVSPNGLKAMALSYDGYLIEYNLSQAHNLDTLSYAGRTRLISEYNVPSAHRDIAISPAGTRVIVLSTTFSSPLAITYVLQYQLGSSYNLSSVTYQGFKNLTTISANTNWTSSSYANSIEFDNNGNNFFVNVNSIDVSSAGALSQIERYFLGTAYDIRGTFTASWVTRLRPPIWYPSGTSTNGINVQKIRFVNSGTQLAIAGATWYNYGVYLYDLSTAYEISSGGETVVAYKNSPDDQTASDIIFKPDGSSFYFMQYGESVQFYCPAPFDIRLSLYTGYNWYEVYDISNTELYWYRVYKSGSIYKSLTYHYVFGQGLKASVITDSTTVYEVITNESDERKATLISDGTGGQMFVINTLIWTPQGIYTLSHLTKPIEYEQLAYHSYTPIVSPEQIPSFSYLSPTNDQMPFDNKNYTIATSNVTMTYEIRGEQPFDTIALGNIRGHHITITFTDINNPDTLIVIESDIDTTRDTHGHLPHWHTTLIYYVPSDVVLEAGSSVEVVITGDLVELGTLMLGISAEAGFTNLQLQNTYKDFSVFEYDPFGNADYTERAKISRYSGTVDMRIENYDMTDRLMTSLGKNLVIINGSDLGSDQADSTSIFSATQKIGRFVSFTQKTLVKDDDLDIMATYSFTLEEIV